MSEEKIEIKGKETKTLVILRGISGSGKSTLSKKLISENNSKGVIYSTDDFFIKDGVYKFDGALLGKAHNFNQSRAIKSMKEGESLIIIDNTNTQKWEAKPYVEAGLEFGYKILIDEPKTEWAKDAKELAKRNTHGVPYDSIVSMLKRWENDFTVENIMKSEPPKRKKK